MAAPVLDERLRSPALHQQWADWVAAWQALDAQALPPLLLSRSGRLTLCGESSSASWQVDGGWWRRVTAPLRRPSVAQTLAGL